MKSMLWVRLLFDATAVLVKRFPCFVTFASWLAHPRFTRPLFMKVMAEVASSAIRATTLFMKHAPLTRAVEMTSRTDRRKVAQAHKPQLQIGIDFSTGSGGHTDLFWNFQFFELFNNMNAKRKSSKMFIIEDFSIFDWIEIEFYVLIFRRQRRLAVVRQGRSTQVLVHYRHRRHDLSVRVNHHRRLMTSRGHYRIPWHAILSRLK